MFRATIFAVLTIAFSTAMSCAALADQYVGGSSAFAIFVAWTADGAGHLQGQVQTVSLAGAKVDRISASFSGTRSGSDVSLVFPLLSDYSGQTWTGNFGFRSLTLQLSNNAELQLSAGSFSDFRERVASLERTASMAASAQADAEAHAQRIADAQRALDVVSMQWNNAKRQLVSALSELKGMLPIPALDPSDPRSQRARYTAAVAKIETAWSHEQEVAAATPLTCYKKGQVQYAAGQVSYARSQLEYQDSQFASFDQTATRDITQAQAAIDAMEQIYPVFKARYREYRWLVPTIPEPQLTEASIAKMKRDIAPLLTEYNNRLTRARGVVHDADQTGDRINAQASEFPASLSCSG
jgi:hypothetical protein